METFLDYELIRHILNELLSVYPNKLHRTQLRSLNGLPQGYSDKILSYLSEHNLINIDMMSHFGSGGGIIFGKMAITAKGIDFLQPDGGLSSLTADVIRIVPDNIISIIDAALASRGLSVERRTTIQKSLGIAGTTALKTIVQRIIDAGITYIPDIGKLFSPMA